MELNHNKESYRDNLQSRIEAQITNILQIYQLEIKEVTHGGVTPIQRCWDLVLLAK